MLMPFELYNGATCPYCGKGIIKVSEGRCNICKKEFATIWKDDGKGHEKNFLVDHGHVQDFLADFMNPPERDLDSIFEIKNLCDNYDEIKLTDKERDEADDYIRAVMRQYPENTPQRYVVNRILEGAKGKKEEDYVKWVVSLATEITKNSKEDYDDSILYHIYELAQS